MTALELAARLRDSAPDVEVLGLEIDPARVDRARSQLERLRAGATPFAADLRVDFARGGFEIPAPRRPAVIRAFNVLRQYDEGDVRTAWEQMTARLHPEGVLIEGTCDEIGRIMTWIDIGPDSHPRTLTVSLRLAGLDAPSVAAERLPKALIHRNVTGERIHVFLSSLDREWERAAAMAAFSPVQRWRAALSALDRQGWPLRGRHRWRLGEVTVDWEAVAPA
ncbi:hypothetical protein GCM10009808_15130 [Microbacterium sediminicola]|uniref:Class I SAM-dependent methyltransferase n=1 Tax=Microbacterium sediminicola TaxID=415210 RepID=A0ABN2I4Q4_9MICO